MFTRLLLGFVLGMTLVTFSPGANAQGVLPRLSILGSSQGASLGGDIESLAFLTLMEAAKSAQDDLQAILADEQEIINEKESIRGLENRVEALTANISAVENRAALFGERILDHVSVSPWD